LPNPYSLQQGPRIENAPTPDGPAPGHVSNLSPLSLLSALSQHHIQLQLGARMHRIYQVVHAIDFHDVDVILVAPCYGPRLYEIEVISAIGEL
jgi:hypothetical protein